MEQCRSNKQNRANRGKRTQTVLIQVCGRPVSSPQFRHTQESPEKKVVSRTAQVFAHYRTIQNRTYVLVKQNNMKVSSRWSTRNSWQHP